MKINFDAAFDGSNAKSASGVVVRNAKGEILTFKITFRESVPKEFATDALACFKGILLGAQLGFESVIVEDFQYVPKTANHLKHMISTESMKKGKEVYHERDVSGFVKEALDWRRPRAPD
ncbi:hypothetical protein Gogos_002129 [Gossypium gossypioides]|uniref:RNase H type-1 domain-containing protein n=1 Tax=Gossypium gossypioides TaxID=34282 RepID=A0A7J9CQG1_GOSGO|nr:hypothetical protein [Gossypium gossypioides]